MDQKSSLANTSKLGSTPGSNELDLFQENNSSTPENCHRLWPYSVVPIVSVFFGGILIIIFFRALSRIHKKVRYQSGKQSERVSMGEYQKPTTAQSLAAYITSVSNLSVNNDEYEDDDAEYGSNRDDENNGENVISGENEMKKGVLTRGKMFFVHLISAQCGSGIILISVSCIFSIISLVIYIIDASKENPVEKDYFVKYYPSDILDMVCNLFFLFHFIFKFIAANDKLRFWVELTTVVDMVTIPPMFVALYLHKYWLGLRFVCVFRLLNFSDVLQSLYLLRTSNHIRLVELFSMFICVWVGSGGFIHLVENSGDPFTCYDNVHRISYWESMYLVIITMSTVGYGDEYCVTVLGKIFIVVFLFGAIAMFASSVPEIIEIFHHSRDKYMLCYKKEPGVRHLIVGGHISFQTVGNFVRNFSHNDRLNKNLKSIILDDNPPSIELESLYKRYYNQIFFVKGSIMVIKDLKRAKLSSAEAVLIMTNQSAPSATEEDTDNIMRAIAVKNYCPKARIILQLLKAENKTICKNLPFWTSRDHIICFTEMKMAFMAAGCLAPGFSTFLSNLLLMFSYDKKIKNLIEWQNDYLKGAEMEIYTERFSPFFHKKPVHEVVKFCYTKFHMLLLAVMNSVDSRGEVNTRLLINSTGDDAFIGPQTLGFFICTNKSKARIALLYCPKCHENSAPTFTHIKKCSCVLSVKFHDLLLQSQANNMPRNHSKELMSPSSSPLMLSPSFLLSSSPPPSAPHLSHTLSSPFTHLLTDTLSASSMVADDCYECNSNSSNLTKGEGAEYLSCVDDEDGDGKSDDVLSNAARGIDQRNDGKESYENFDVTGFFHWTPSRRLTDCLLDRRKNQDVCDRLADHVVLCLSHHSQCSLRSFLLPLRTSSLKGENLRAVVIVAKERSFVEREWAHICHFPAVYVKIGSPLNRGVLRSVRIERCHMCVVHSAQRSSTLLHSSMLTSAQSLPSSPPPTSSSSLATHDDSKALLITLNIKNMSFKNVELKYSGTGYDILRRFIRATKNSSISVFESLDLDNEMKSTIPILTELLKDENVQFIDQDDEDDPDTPFHLTQPFACGRAFASRVLDALSITIIFNPETYDLFRVFVTGTDSEEHDHLMAEGFTEQSCQMSAEQLKTIRNRPRLNLLPVNTGILKDLSEDTFGHLFTKSLSVHGILCLGLYRLVNVYARSTSDPNNRFVITNPSPGMKLHFTDKVYCICTQPTADC